MIIVPLCAYDFCALPLNPNYGPFWPFICLGLLLCAFLLRFLVAFSVFILTINKLKLSSEPPNNIMEKSVFPWEKSLGVCECPNVDDHSKCNNGFR